MGHALRWYLNSEMGSDNQKRLYQKEAFQLMAMRPAGHMKSSVIFLPKI